MAARISKLTRISAAAGSIRLDKLLWYLRLARSRSLAQAMVAAGHIRLDGRRVTRAACPVHAGQTLVLPVGERIEVLRLLALPGRRGPASEAEACYRRLTGGAHESDSQLVSAIDASPPRGIGGGELQHGGRRDSAARGSPNP